MKKRINCFIPFGTSEDTMQTVKELQASELVDKIYLLGSAPGKKCLPDCEWLPIDGLYSTSTMKTIAAHASTDYILLYTKQTPLKLGLYALERMVQVMENNMKNGIVYADRYQQIHEELKQAPVIDYQWEVFEMISTSVPYFYSALPHSLTQRINCTKDINMQDYIICACS